MRTNAMDYTIYRVSSEKDKRDLLKFWSENRGRDLDEKYEWIYENNPAGKAIVSLITDNEQNELVGCSVVFPKQVSIQGENINAGVVGDVLVHRKHRVLVPALKLVKALASIVQERELDLLYGFPNDKAAPVMKRAGFRCLGPTIRMAKVTTTSGLLQKLRFGKSFAAAFSPLLDFAVKLCAFETWYRFRGGFTCEEVCKFDERFDELWRKSRSRLEIAGERTSQFLTWRFLKSPKGEHKIFIISDSHAEVKGYFVYRMDEDTVIIRDFILPEDKKAIHVFMTHFLRHVRKVRPKSVAVNFLKNEEMLRLFKRFGFVRRKGGWSAYCHCSKDVLSRFPVLEDSENWLLLGGDADNA